jgi:SAM-dependent methyltransferase
MATTTWLPGDESLSTPNAARMYDFFLGGYHNFASDREAAERAIAIYPEFPLVMRTNRTFLRRAVRFLVAQGIDQFLDFGSGIPTVGNVHEVAQSENPAARVVYVDIDPIAVAHSRAILGGNPGTLVLHADGRRPEEILANPEVQRLLDLDRPLAVLIVFLLHFISDDAEALRLVQVLRDAMPVGSYLVLSHGTMEGIPPAICAQLERVYARTDTPVRIRTRAEVLHFFAGLELVAPGLVYCPLWRPESDHDVLLAHPERSLGFAGVARKG